MDNMAEHLGTLEQYADLEAEIIKDTKANKLLKVILKLPTIPRDEEFRFKERCRSLLDTWNKTVNDVAGKPKDSPANGIESEKKESSKAESASGDTPAPNGHTNEAKPADSASPAEAAKATTEEPKQSETEATPAAAEENTAPAVPATA
jgi:hypothetical protein